VRVHGDFAVRRFRLVVTLNRFGAALSMMTAVALVLSACSSDSSASSTAQANAMTRFVATFEDACPGQSLSYTSNGSGAGGADTWHLPVVFGPLAITYNLANVDTLVLDAPTLAKIFDGTITRWDDPAIARLNQSMPSQPITVVYRSDESGSTDTFQQYLAAASDGAWGKGAGRTWNGGVGTGAVGNEGTSKTVNNTDGAISYNELSFAQAQNLLWAKIVTPAGRAPVTISAESVGKTIDEAKVAVSGNDLKLDTSSFFTPTEAGAYPVVLTTYEVVCSKYPDAETGKAVRAFLQSTIGRGQPGLADHGYIPLPADFQAKVAAAVDAIS
jgi:phosphate transport system substrate-binding protein